MMASTEHPMSALELSGEARAKAKRRRVWWSMGGIGVLSFVPGFYLGYSGHNVIDTPGASWPPVAVIVTAIVYLLVVIGGSVLLRRHIDELAMHNRLRATALAAGVYIIVYPVWWLLWMGALVPEPSHWQLFLLFYVSFVFGCFYYARKTV